MNRVRWLYFGKIGVRGLSLKKLKSSFDPLQLYGHFWLISLTLISPLFKFSDLLFFRRGASD